MTTRGTLHLIPVGLGQAETALWLPASAQAQAGKLDTYIAENAKTARSFLKLMPLDTYVPSPVELMDVVPGDPIGTPPIWAVYKEIIRKHSPETAPAMIERHAFYEKSRGAFVIIQTGETALYANIILSKGVVK